MSPQPPRRLRFNAFSMNCVSHIHHGQWVRTDTRQTEYNTLAPWIELARLLERGKFDALFLADVVGTYETYRGGRETAITEGLQIPVNDPSVLVAAALHATDHLGFAFTQSVLQEQPFGFARRLSTLDHLSGGRVGWNVVTSYLEGAGRNFGFGGLPPHDARYARADEYLEVLYKLLEGSWEDDAVVIDRERRIYADPSKIHEIDHVGEHYDVLGPHLSEPSPQRTPLLFQAGSSPVGRRFAARNAEAQFIVSPNPEKARALIDDTRRLVVEHGRQPGDLKFFQGLSFVIGSTETEAEAKAVELEEKTDIHGMIAHFGGSLGIDLGSYDPETPIDLVHTEGGQSGLAWLRESTGGRTPTLGDVTRLRARGTRLVGTPEQIADRLAAWRDAGVDGINVINATIPGSYDELIEHLLPVLRARGLARDEYADGTLRRKLFGSDRLSARHPAARYRGAFAPELQAANSASA
ncbi:MAG TPA: LLM class flavin-dependent oxidoreductase [Baekduia sp.]|nr:LLM class flavin-dependent oxidoreductase [Baekduia sp.]